MDLKFKPAYATEIFVSDAGYLCIAQTNNSGREEVTLLSPEQSYLLLRNFADILEEQHKNWDRQPEQE